MEKAFFNAEPGQLDAVQDFVAACAKQCGAGEEHIMKISLAVEEVFVNIASYAYTEPGGQVEVACGKGKNGRVLEMFFADTGHKYNPLLQDEPDITLAAEERGIGGLGIFLVKQLMEKVEYNYSNGKNILKLSYAYDN